MKNHRFCSSFWRRCALRKLGEWLFGALAVIWKVILQILGARLWSTGLPKANIIASWAHLGPILGHLGDKLGPKWVFLGAYFAISGNLAGLQAHLGPILEHLGAKLGPRWVFLGASWAMLRHFGALWEAPGRHLEASAGLGRTELELTCGNKATGQNLQKPTK